jgi:hypothetical protein
MQRTGVGAGSPAFEKDPDRHREKYRTVRGFTLHHFYEVAVR